VQASTHAHTHTSPYALTHSSLHAHTHKGLYVALSTRKQEAWNACPKFNTDTNIQHTDTHTHTHTNTHPHPHNAIFRASTHTHTHTHQENSSHPHSRFLVLNRPSTPPPCHILCHIIIVHGPAADTKGSCVMQNPVTVPPSPPPTITFIHPIRRACTSRLFPGSVRSVSSA